MNILDKFSLKGKKALIVCPENTYGAQIAQALEAAGAEIYLAGDVPTDIPAKKCFLYHHGQLDSAIALAKEVSQQIGAPDIVVENGLCVDSTGWEQSYAQINEQLKKTHLGLMLTVQHLGELMAKKGSGSMILVTDYGALVGYDVQNYVDCPELAEKDFSFVKGFVKGAAVNYARQASNYLAENGCRCNALAFGPMAGQDPAFEEAFVRHSQVKRLATAEDIAGAVVFFASDASAFITGITMPVDGGYTAK